MFSVKLRVCQYKTLSPIILDQRNKEIQILFLLNETEYSRKGGNVEIEWWKGGCKDLESWDPLYDEHACPSTVT